ncbi:MAG: hypothetical protein LQ347_002973 [Umbilicaria vellea]|nr:MAG: hypothetical protein LQ347_002973 [Umbilicaria vellea]
MSVDIIRYFYPASYAPRMTSAGRGAASLSPLLQLPTEIRNTIYQLVMKSSNPIERERGTYALFPDKDTRTQHDTRAWYQRRPHIETPTSLSLALTCSQLYRETSGYYYTLNRFLLSLPDFVDFAHSIRSSNLNRISMIHITVPTECPLTYFVYPFTMMGLKQLHFKLEKRTPGGVDGDEAAAAAVEKMCKLSKSLEVMSMSFAWRDDLVYHWEFAEHQTTARELRRSARQAVPR